MSKVKRILLTILVVLPVLICLKHTPAHAAEVVTGGICGEDVFWSLDADGTLTISGTGEM